MLKLFKGKDALDASQPYNISESLTLKIYIISPLLTIPYNLLDNTLFTFTYTQEEMSLNHKLGINSLGPGPRSGFKPTR